MALVRKTMTIAMMGTSLTTGRLAADWVPLLNKEARTFPETKGPIFIYNLGHGGWTSLDILNAAPIITQLKPTHILTEGGAINDCFDSGSGPAISRPTHIANIQAFIGQWLSGIPGVDITLQTMNSVSSYQTGRTQLPAYYADEIATATGLGVRVLDNFNGTATVPGGWPKPLPGALTNGGPSWSYAPTTGYLPLPDAETWNPADKVNINLSADDLTATGSVPAVNGGVRGVTSIGGKIHFEATLGVLNAGTSIGIANAAADLSQPLGIDNNSISFTSLNTTGAGTGAVQFGGSTIGTFDPDSPVVVAIEVDVPNGLIYIVTGAGRFGGFSFAGIGSGSLFPVFGSFGSANSCLLRPNLDGDGLHPLWLGADDTYLYPNVRGLYRARAAAFWP